MNDVQVAIITYIAVLNVPVILFIEASIKSMLRQRVRRKVFKYLDARLPAGWFIENNRSLNFDGDLRRKSQHIYSMVLKVSNVCVDDCIFKTCTYNKKFKTFETEIFDDIRKIGWT